MRRRKVGERRKEKMKRKWETRKVKRRKEDQVLKISQSV